MSNRDHLKIVARTDKGRNRIINEDCFSVINGKNLIIVSDGAGGHKQGDFASRLVVDTIEDYYFSDEDFIRSKLTKHIPQGLSDDAIRLIIAIRLANYRLYKINDIHSESSHLLKNKALAALCVLSINNGVAHIANVGDSRVYRIREGKLKCLTDDHISFQKVTKNGKTYYKEYLTRAMGIEEGVVIDLRVEKSLKGDIYLLCSDGLYKMLNERQMLDVISEERENLDKASEELIELSNEKGGKDNITLSLVMDCSDENLEYNSKIGFFPISALKGKASRKTLLNGLKKIYA